MASMRILLPKAQLATITVCLLVTCAFLPVNAADYVWIEGEAAPQHSMRPQGWYDRVNKENLSGGEWLSHFAGGAPPVATYPFSIDQAGEYHFWLRCNPVADPRISYQVDDGGWQPIDLGTSIQRVNIAADGKPDIRFVGWVQVGLLPLKTGRHALQFRFESSNNSHGAIDCFVLSQKPFRPRGILKPGERSGRANPGFFAWEPDVDHFGSEAMVDLSSMNEDIAGANGRVRATDEGFALGDGTPVKFWASNGGPGIWGLDHESHVYLAKRLAKAGVNMVRLHGGVFGSRNPEVNYRKLDQLQHLVYALKNEGIYTAISFYFPLWFQLDGDRHPFMLLFFDPEMQQHYYRWADALLTTKSPYTELSLGQDPAVAIVEIQNEDSLFFWTFSQKNMPAERWSRFKAVYGDWLTKKYGSLEKAQQAWGDVTEPGDDPDAGQMELYDAWNMTSQGAAAANKGKRTRLRDQVQFLTEQMRLFYQQACDHMRNKDGYDGLISCGNWHVADPATLDALERYCYTVGDVIDHHGYFDHGHEGENASWSVRPGQTFRSQSALNLKQANPLPYVETLGYPHIVSEIGWPMPNMYRAEFPFLAAAYGSLQGLDGIFTFALGSAGWDTQISKFPVSTPVTLGSFPAAAVIYRRGYVQEAPIVVKDNVDLEKLYALEGTPVHVAPAFDQFRTADIPQTEVEKGPFKAIDPLTFYVGRVTRSLEGPAAESLQKNVKQYIDRERQRVRSITNELIWDYGSELVAMNTAKAQGVAGFLGKRAPLALGNVEIDMDNPYGTVTVVSLDDKPIADSRKILIQGTTIEQFAGFATNQQGNLEGRIENVGSAPCGVELLDVTVKLKLQGGVPTRVIACDEHGYPTERTVNCSGPAADFSIQLNPQSVYHVVER
jgi:hypothetical protein